MRGYSEAKRMRKGWGRGRERMQRQEQRQEKEQMQKQEQRQEQEQMQTQEQRQEQEQMQKQMQRQEQEQMQKQMQMQMRGFFPIRLRSANSRSPFDFAQGRLSASLRSGRDDTSCVRTLDSGHQLKSRFQKRPEAYGYEEAMCDGESSGFCACCG